MLTLENYVPPAVSPELTIPDWAPIISVDVDAREYLDDIDFSYEDMAKLVEDQGVPKEELSRLRIHISALDHYEGEKSIRKKSKLPRASDAGDYIPRGFLKRKDRPEYTSMLSSIIAGHPGADLDFKNTAFILVNLLSCMGDWEDAKPGPIRLRKTVIHELGHFEGDRRLHKWGKTISKKDHKKFNLKQWQENEEERVIAKEHDAIKNRKYGAIVTASLRVD